MQDLETSYLDFYKFTITTQNFLRQCRNWFSNRVVGEWNKLSNHIVSAGTIAYFKSKLGSYMDGDDRW